LLPDLEPSRQIAGGGVHRGFERNLVRPGTRLTEQKAPHVH